MSAYSLHETNAPEEVTPARAVAAGTQAKEPALVGTHTVHIQLPFDLDPAATAAVHAAGLTPDRVAYGFHHAEAIYQTVSYSRQCRESWLCHLVRRSVVRLLGFDFVHAWRNRRALDQADVVWTMLETEYLAVLLVFLLRPWVKAPPVLAQTVWLFDSLETQRLPLSRFLAGRASMLLTHSLEYLPVMAQHFPGTNRALNYFGVSGDTFPVTPPTYRDRLQVITVLAAGNDRTRDWPTLLEAFGNQPGFRVVLVCTWVDDAVEQQYGNVTLVRNPDLQQFKALYAECDHVVIPMLPNRYSGITVALEAAALGTSVVCARTGGVPTYFSEDEVIYVEPCNPLQLRAAVQATSPAKRLEFALRAQQRYVSSGYTTRDMVGRYKAMSDEVLHRAGESST